MSCIIVAGGYEPWNSIESVEVIFGDLKTKQLTRLPKEIEASMFITFDEDSDDEMKHPECCQTGFFYSANRSTRGLKQK